MCHAVSLVTGQSFFTNQGEVISIVPGTKLTIIGSAVNSGTIRNEGVISVSRDWTNLNSYLSQNGKFVLNGITVQTIDHNNQTFYSLELSGGGRKVFVSDIDVVSELVLIAGVAEIAEEKTFLLRDGVSVIGGNSDSYLEGALSRSGEGDLLFPIGSSNGYSPIELLAVSGDAPINKIEVISANPSATAGLGLNEISIDRFWQRSLTSGTFNGSQVRLNVSNERIVTNINKVVVASANEESGDFVSLGQSDISGNDGQGSVTSTNRSNQLIYAVGTELSEDRITDSLALVTLYNVTGGENWFRKDNWLEEGSSLENWEGINTDPTSGRVTTLSLPNNNLTMTLPNEIRSLNALVNINLSGNLLHGEVPTQLNQLENLEQLDLSDNNFSSLPDLSNLPSLILLNVFDNQMKFTSLEPNINITGFNFDPQNSIGDGGTFLLDKGQNFTIDLLGGSPNNQYKWYLNDQLLLEETNSFIEIFNLGRNNTGDYRCEITNTVVPGFTLNSKVNTVLAKASISGKALVSDREPLTAGIVKLLQVLDGPYDTVAIQPLLATGSYSFEDVILGDYIILVEPFEEGSYLPTYHENSIQWDRASVLLLEEDTTNINVLIERIPLDIGSGSGALGGTVYSDFSDTGAGGRVEARRRVRRVGCALRRRRSQGRIAEDEEFELYAYTFTDDDGMFSFGNLPAGAYRIFVEYPGIPINEESFTQFEITEDIEDTEVTIEVTVFEDEIVIDLVEATGIPLDYIDQLSIYPNPTDKDFINVKISARRPYEVKLELIDLRGVTVLSDDIKNSNLVNGNRKLNLTNIGAGIYLVKITIPSFQNQVLSVSKLVINGR